MGGKYARGNSASLIVSDAGTCKQHGRVTLKQRPAAGSNQTTKLVSVVCRRRIRNAQCVCIASAVRRRACGIEFAHGAPADFRGLLVGIEVVGGRAPKPGITAPATHIVDRHAKRRIATRANDLVGGMRSNGKRRYA